MDFIYEEIAEGEFDFDFYILYMQTECDDPYYPPYNRNIGIFKSKDYAIQDARKRFYKMTDHFKTPEDRKYGGVEGMFYIEGGYFNDNMSVNKTVLDKPKPVSLSHKPLYMIYDKEEQERVDARWERMHGKRGF